MSYARKGVDSDIFVYRRIDGMYECSMCPIGVRSMSFTNVNHLAVHVLDHVDNGDKVPLYCLEFILRDVKGEDEKYDESITCDVCDGTADPGGSLSHCVDCGNCLDHCECSTPDYDAMAKDALIDELYDERYV